MNDTASTKPNPAEELRKAMEQQKALDEKISALREETREADLAKVKELIGLHGFTQTDLRSVLKAKGATRTAKKSTRGRRKTS